ncbi:MAG TPA: SRPBCC domain-containing protein [Lacunisphaera sp.]|nr:SRPBCC domain-containing protein [Lacunisphaera sp.]
MPRPATSSNPAPAPGIIVTTRVIAATPREVFAAFSDPVRLALWWGPKGFTSRFQQFNFHKGGLWMFTMHGPDGTAYAMTQQFAEIVPTQRIVVHHFQPGHDFTLTMTFVALDRGTRLTWDMQFADPAEGERVRPFVVPANEENFDRLTEHLAQTAKS